MNKSLATVAAVVLCACSGSQAPPSESGFLQPTLPPTAQGSEGSGSSEVTPPGGGESKGGLTDDQKAQMEIALKRGGKKAAECADSVPDAVRGEGEVKVTFDGQKGRVTEATVGPPFAGTPVEACIKRSFEKEIVVPFEGPPLDVPYTVKLPEKKGAVPDKKKK